jgi:hypothetical protein
VCSGVFWFAPGRQSEILTQAAASKSDVNTPPSEFQPDQPPPGEVCQLCHNALSVPLAKTSKRPSALRATSMSLVITPPSDAQPDQPPFGVVCQLCQTALSVPLTKSSKRPSALRLMDGSLVITPPSENPPDQPPLGTVWQVVPHSVISSPGEDLEAAIRILVNRTEARDDSP